WHIKLIIRTPAEQLNGVLNNHIDLALGSYNSQVHNIISEPLYREQHWHIKLIIRTPAEQLNGVLNNHIDLA
ncbi:hypothetical protein Q6294_34885, partial [Klebsiella pneumoniae]|nr:hypothetical protein [Klebsiella pneumoniae]